MNEPPSPYAVLFEDLDALIAATSRLLLGEDEISPASAERIHAELGSHITELDNAIASIKAQLETRHDDQRWRASARRAHRHYQQQRVTLCAAKAKSRRLIHHIGTHNQKIQKAASKRETHRAHLEKMKTQAEVKRAQKVANIHASNDRNEPFNKAFRKVVRQRYGDEAFGEIVAEANRLIEAAQPQG